MTYIHCRLLLIDIVVHIDSLCIINTPHGRYYEGFRVKYNLLISNEADMISMVVNHTIDKYKCDKFVLENPSAQV